MRIAPAKGKRLRQCLPGELAATFAGAEANVAFALSQFGTNARFLGAIPDNDLGSAAAAALQTGGIDTAYLLRKPGTRLGLFYYEPAADPRPGKVIYDRDGSATALSAPSDYPMEEAVTGVSWIHLSGITPAISRQGFKSCLALAKLGQAKGIPVSLDLNLRSQLWRWSPNESPRQLMQRCLQELLPLISTLIASDGQVSDAFGIEAELNGEKRLSEAKRLMQTLASRYPRLERIVFSHRETVSPDHSRIGGLLYETTSGRFWLAPSLENGNFSPYDIRRVADRLGTGDAFAAGYIHATLENDSAEGADAIAFAAAAGALAHSIEGDFNWVDAAEVQSFLQCDTHRGIVR